MGGRLLFISFASAVVDCPLPSAVVLFSETVSMAIRIMYC